MPHLRTPTPQVNTSFNWLIFKSEDIGPDRRTYWNCECVCGKKVRRRPITILSGYIKSCGCQRKRENLCSWKGCGDISGAFFACIKGGARHRNVLFDLTIKYIWEVFLKQNGRCALTGMTLTFATIAEQKRGLVQTASLDRIDSSKGYVEGNVQWVHKDVNCMKNDIPQERFIEYCKLVAAKAEPCTPEPHVRADPTQQSPGM